MVLSLAAGSFFEQYWPVLVILVALIALYIVSIVRRKKDMGQAQQMLNELKPGTKVKTYTGFYGTIDSIRETTDGKVVMLKIGEEGGKIGYIEIDANAIYGVDTKTDVVYDKDGNVIVKDSKGKKDEKGKAKNKKDAKDKEEKDETKVEDKKEEEIKEEKTVIEDTPKPIKKPKQKKQEKA